MKEIDTTALRYRYTRKWKETRRTHEQPFRDYSWRTFLSLKGSLAATSSFLTDIDKLYTMESEREYIRGMWRNRRVSAGQRHAGAAADDLGENVELF